MTSLSFPEAATTRTVTKQQRSSSSATSTATSAVQSGSASASQSSAETFASHFQNSSASQHDGETDVQKTITSFILKAKKDTKGDGSPRKTSKETSANDKATVTAAPVQQPADTRSWLLSWQNNQPSAATATTPLTEDKTATAKQPAPTDPTGALKNVLQGGAPDGAEAHALQKAQIAFSVTIPPTDSSHPAAATPTVTAPSTTQAETKSVTPMPKVSEAAGSVKPGPLVSSSKATAAKDPATTATAASPAVAKPSAKENSKHSSDKDHSNPSEKDQNVTAPATKSRDERDGQAGLTHAGTSSVHGAADASSESVPASAPQHVSTAYTAATKPEAAAPTSPTADVSEDLKPSTIAKPQSIDLKVGTQDGDQVDVRVSQRAGDVQVTVRTADGQLAQSLRHHLPELSDRLAQNGIQGDFWQPSASQSSSAHSDGDTQEFSDRNGSQSQEQQNQGRNRSDAEGESKRQSAWLNEMNKVETRD